MIKYSVASIWESIKESTMKESMAAFAINVHGINSFHNKNITNMRRELTLECDAWRTFLLCQTLVAWKIDFKRL